MIANSREWKVGDIFCIKGTDLIDEKTYSEHGPIPVPFKVISVEPDQVMAKSLENELISVSARIQEGAEILPCTEEHFMTYAENVFLEATKRVEMHQAALTSANKVLLWKKALFQELHIKWENF